jgi:membrane-bound ClpP family serine protease
METALLIGIGLLALALLLLVLEAFVPSGGILGVSSFLTAIVGIVFLFRYDALWGATGLLVTVVLGPMAFVSAIKMLPSTAIGRTMVGRSSEEIADQKQQVTMELRAKRERLMDQKGIALTAMRPSGVIEVDGERHDAIARGGLVDKGQPVRVVKVDGLTIEVRPIG